jgi:aspartyl-tRNA(Asn)/glutamyl-tRNA(Gln) amidotransferase subunit A
LSSLAFMTDRDLDGLTLCKALQLIRQRQISSSELRDTVLARIDRLNPEMHAFITVPRGNPITGDVPPLFGIPVSAKDLYDTKGVRTTGGARLYSNRVPEDDAAAVTKLKQAGGVIIGKTNLHEFAYGVTTVNPHFGTARNPWDHDRIAGGSSGGSAVAVALSMGFGSLGTDTGGSIRIPAALCGIVGLKPTYGRVSLEGVIPLSPSLDHAGPMTKTVADAALLLKTISDFDPGDCLTGNMQGIRIGIPMAYVYESLDPGVDNAVREALNSMQRMGATIIDVDLPGFSDHQAIWVQIAGPEAYAYHERNLKEHGDTYGEDVRTRLETARNMLSVDYVKAQEMKKRIQKDCRKLFEECDVIVTPTVPVPAPRINRAETAIPALGRFTRYFNLTGLPAISIPCGFTPDELPVGLQIAGKPFDEETVLRAAYAYEQNARWFEHQPPTS